MTELTSDIKSEWVQKGACGCSRMNDLVGEKSCRKLEMKLYKGESYFIIMFLSKKRVC